MESKGFTIIELIIAIFLLVGAVIGVFSVFSTMSFLTSDATDRLTAVYLAQEGVEIVQNIRDRNWLNDGFAWDYDLNACETGCEADYTMPQPQPWAESYLYISNDAAYNTKGFYSYAQSNAIKTKFQRKITINVTNCVMKVIVEVFWTGKANIIIPNTNNSVKIEESLYNWYNGTNCTI